LRFYGGGVVWELSVVLAFFLGFEAHGDSLHDKSQAFTYLLMNYIALNCFLNISLYCSAVVVIDYFFLFGGGINLSRKSCKLRAENGSPWKTICLTGVFSPLLLSLRYALTSIQRMEPSDVRITSITG
jgi:hypothetical protein